MTERDNSEFNRLDKQLKFLTTIMRGLAVASAVVMFLSIAVATLVILSR